MRSGRGRPMSPIALLIAAALLSGCALFLPTAPKPPSLIEEVKQQIHQKGASDLTLGTARVEITPPVGTPLAGYSKRHGKPSIGIRDPLYVRVLALSDGEDLVLLVSADLLVFPHPWAEELITQLANELKIPRHAVILAATHTHSGAGGIAQGFLHEQVFGPYRAHIAEGIANRLLFAAKQALEHRHPVRWALAGSREALKGLIENRMDPLGLTDPSVTVLLFESNEGKPKAILVNAAAHPTLLDSQDMRLSADYPGELTRVMEAAYPGAICFFFNGAAGDLRPRDAIGSTSQERVSRFGQALAEATTGLMSQMVMRSKGDLSCWGWRVPLPPPQLSIGILPIHPSIGRLMRPSSVALNLCALDEALFVPMPVELTTQYGQALRSKLTAKGEHPILIGYANGYLGYAVTPEQYRGKSYEAWMTWYGPGFGESFVEGLLSLASIYSPAGAARQK